MTYQRLSVSKKRLTLNLCDLVLIPNKTKMLSALRLLDGQDKKATTKQMLHQNIRKVCLEQNIANHRLYQKADYICKIHLFKHSVFSKFFALLSGILFCTLVSSSWPIVKIFTVVFCQEFNDKKISYQWKDIIKLIPLLA